MIQPRFILSFFFILCNSWLASQEVSEIRFEGLSSMDPAFLQNYINLDIHSLSTDDIEQARDRLNRLNGILNNKHRLETTDSSSILVFEIEEQGSLKPILGLAGIRDNFWVQLGGIEFNLNGKNQTLLGYYLNNNGRHNYKLFFENDRFRGGNWGYGIDVQRIATEEPLYFESRTENYYYTNVAAGGLLNRYIGLNTKGVLGVTLFNEEYRIINENNVSQEIPNIVDKTKVLGKIGLNYNQLMYDYFYRGGFIWDLLFQQVYTPEDNDLFLSLSFESRNFWRVKNYFNIATRLKVAMATNKASPFAPFTLDSNFNIRGVGNRVDRGTGQIVLNTEIRTTLWNSFPWAIQGITFVDSGTWRNPGGPLSQLWDPDQFQLFSGGGIRIIYTRWLEAVLRIDYGIDVLNRENKGVVIGLGQYF